MTRRITLTLALTLLTALAGCTPGGQETPAPETTVYTPVPSPTPSWSAEEQGAIDAIQKYLTVWTSIGQDLVGSDWDDIHDVAADPAANDSIDTWSLWAEKGWHLVGSPVFEVDRVAEGATDYQGTIYHVHGCYISVDAHLVDQDGATVVKQGADRSTANYLVLHMTNPADNYYVLEDVLEGNQC